MEWIKVTDPIPEDPSFQSNINFALSKFHEIHEKLLKDVMRQVFDREPTKEDAMRFTMDMERPPNYTLLFDGLPIGRVEFNMGTGFMHNLNDLEITFHPRNPAPVSHPADKPLSRSSPQPQPLSAFAGAGR